MILRTAPHFVLLCISSITEIGDFLSHLSRIATKNITRPPGNCKEAVIRTATKKEQIKYLRELQHTGLLIVLNIDLFKDLCVIRSPFGAFHHIGAVLAIEKMALHRHKFAEDDFGFVGIQSAEINFTVFMLISENIKAFEVILNHHAVGDVDIALPVKKIGHVYGKGAAAVIHHAEVSSQGQLIHVVRYTDTDMGIYITITQKMIDRREITVPADFTAEEFGLPVI